MFGDIAGRIETSKITEEPAKKSSDSAIVNNDVDIVILTPSDTFY